VNEDKLFATLPKASCFYLFPKTYPFNIFNLNGKDKVRAKLILKKVLPECSVIPFIREGKESSSFYLPKERHLLLEVLGTAPSVPSFFLSSPLCYS
jgi:hypothetical protein